MVYCVPLFYYYCDFIYLLFNCQSSIFYMYVYIPSCLCINNTNSFGRDISAD